MVDESGGRAAAVEGHLERLDDELRVHVLGHGPADDAATEGVLDRRQVEPALPSGQVGDVGDPEAVGTLASEAAIDEVIGHPDARHADRRAPGAALDQAGEPGLAHEALDPLAPDPHTVAMAELGVHAPDAIDPTSVFVDIADALREPGVGEGAVARGVSRLMRLGCGTLVAMPATRACPGRCASPRPLRGSRTPSCASSRSRAIARSHRARPRAAPLRAPTRRRRRPQARRALTAADRPVGRWASDCPYGGST